MKKEKGNSIETRVEEPVDLQGLGFRARGLGSRFVGEFERV